MPEEDELNSGVLAAYKGLKSWKATISFDEEPGLTSQVWYSAGKWRQEWHVAGGNGTAASVGAGGKIFASCTEGNAPLPMLLYWQTQRPVQTWKALGMDNGTAGFGFCEETPCFTFGAEPGDDMSPQVRLNNETKALLYMRFINAGQQLVFVYEDYATFKGFEFPRKGKLILGDGYEVPFTISWDEINQAADPKLYVPDAFASQYSGSVCGGMPFLYQRLGEQFHSISSSQ